MTTRLLPARLRFGSLVLGLAGLSMLVLAPGGSIAVAQASRATVRQGPVSAVRAADVGARQIAGAGADGGRNGTLTLGPGWEVQSSARATSWTTGTGATQGGAEISAPGFAAAGWLPVTTDDAGAVGTEVEALLQNGLCPLDPGLQPVNQSPAGPSSIFYSTNMQRCLGAPQAQVGADTNSLFDVPWWFRSDFTPDLRAPSTSRS